MASTTRENRDGVEFIQEDDGSVTARDLQTGLARGGRTRAEALVQLAEVLALEAGEGRPIEDAEAFLRDLGVDPDRQEAGEPPWE